MKKLNLEPMRPQTARGYRFLSVPKELIENRNYSSLDLGSVILYAKMIERASLSAQHIDKFTDENGRLFIIYTVEQMKKDIQRSQPTIVKWTKQLEDIGLIEKVRQGQGKPSKIFIMDFMSVTTEPDDSTSKESESQEVKDFNFLKSNNFTSRSKESELPEVKNFNAIELNNKDLENNDLDPTNLPTAWEDGGEEESLPVGEVKAQVRDQIEYPVLCENYDQEIADEVVEIITEVRCRDSPKMKIGNATYPMDLVQDRMQSLTYEHVAYVLENIGCAGPVRNPHGYLLAFLFNAPSSCNAAVQAVFNANQGR